MSFNLPMKVAERVAAMVETTDALRVDNLVVY